MDGWTTMPSPQLLSLTQKQPIFRREMGRKSELALCCLNHYLLEHGADAQLATLAELHRQVFPFLRLAWTEAPKAQAPRLKVNRAQGWLQVAILAVG